MKKIKYYYKNFHLGTLTFENSAYVYNSNFENEKKAIESSLKMQFYRLTNSHNRSSETLFSEFSTYGEALTRSDLVEKAKIKTTDTEFEKLFKLAHLKFPTDDFYISI